MAMPESPDNSSVSALETLKLFRVIFKSAHKHFHEIEKTAGIGGASLWALAEIAETSNLTVSGLAKAMSIHQSTASNLMEKLEVSGYIQDQKPGRPARGISVAHGKRARSFIQGTTTLSRHSARRIAAPESKIPRHAQHLPDGVDRPDGSHAHQWSFRALGQNLTRMTVSG